MSTTLTGNMKLTMSLLHQLTGVDLRDPGETISVNETISLTDGSGANQAERVFVDQRTLGAGLSETLDLAGGLTDVFGNAITFTSIVGLVIIHRSSGGSSSSGIKIDQDGLVNAWDALVDSELRALGQGAWFIAINPDGTGWPVVASTSDLLRITNTDGSNPATYDIYIIGTDS